MNCAEDAAQAAARPLPACLPACSRMLPWPLTQSAGPFHLLSHCLSCGSACCLLPAAPCLLSQPDWGNWSAALLCSVPIFHIYTQYTLLFWFVRCFHTHTHIAPISIMPSPRGTLAYISYVYITIYKYGNAHRSVIRSHLNDCQPTRPE